MEANRKSHNHRGRESLGLYLLTDTGRYLRYVKLVVEPFTLEVQKPRQDGKI